MDKKSGVAPEQVQILTRTLGGLERDRLAKDDPVFTRFLRKSLLEEKTVYFICTPGTPANSAALPSETSPFLYRSTASRILPRVTMSRTALDRSLPSSLVIS